MSRLGQSLPAEVHTYGNVIPISGPRPIHPRQEPDPDLDDFELDINGASISAIGVLARAGLVDEREAVAALHHLGASRVEIELIRTLFALRRNRI